MTIFILACVTAVTVSFLCSLLEATLLSLDDHHLETRRREGHLYAKIWLSLKRQSEQRLENTARPPGTYGAG
jgi:hypothetical protein